MSHLKDFGKAAISSSKRWRVCPHSLKAETVLLLLGEGGETIAEAVGIPALNLGYVSSDQLKAIAYCAADLFILPTRADNLPLGLLESMACGTPLVSFRVGGVPELVRPGITGYLAEPGDAHRSLERDHPITGGRSPTPCYEPTVSRDRPEGISAGVTGATLPGVISAKCWPMLVTMCLALPPLDRQSKGISMDAGAHK